MRNLKKKDWYKNKPFTIMMTPFLLFVLLTASSSKVPADVDTVQETIVETKSTMPVITETIVQETSVPETAIEEIIPETTSEPTQTEVNQAPKETAKMTYKTSTKTYMDYRAITNKSSQQYKLIHSETITICEDGFLRDKDGYIGVAMGSYFGPIGSRHICYLDNGKTIPVIKVEAKADRHTINGFCGSTSYDIIEFVIDTRAEWMQKNKWGNGYIFSGNFNNCDAYKGTIINIEKIN